MSPDDDNGALFNPFNLGGDDGGATVTRYSYSYTDTADSSTVTSPAIYVSEDEAGVAAGVANGVGYADAFAAEQDGVTITQDDNVVLNGSLPWGGIPSNGGNITGSTTSQYYTRSGLGISQTSFGKTGAWGTHCGRKKWALDNGIAWDGVSNSNVDCSNYMGVGNPDNVYSRGVRS